MVTRVLPNLLNYKILCEHYLQEYRIKRRKSRLYSEVYSKCEARSCMFWLETIARILHLPGGEVVQFDPLQEIVLLSITLTAQNATGHAH